MKRKRDTISKWPAHRVFLDGERVGSARRFRRRWWADYKPFGHEVSTSLGWFKSRKTATAAVMRRASEGAKVSGR